MDSMSSLPYDPTLAGLIALTDEDWKNPEEVQAHMVHFGINYVDQALYGLNFFTGDLIGIQSEPKQRKTTLAANIVLNVAWIFSQRTPVYWTCIDTLESGMPPKAYRDMLIAMVATRLLIASVFGKDRKEWPSWRQIASHDFLKQQLGISKEFLWFSSRTPEQFAAIEQAKEILAGMPITIFGTPRDHGNARDLNFSRARWEKLYKGEYPDAAGDEHRFFIWDHVQQYRGFPGDDYRKLEVSNEHHSDFLASHAGAVGVEISQTSVSSVRLAAQGIGRAQAKGGGKMDAEMNVLFQTQYSRAIPHRVVISVPETRRRPPPDVIQELDPDSGAFLRPAYPVDEDVA
jgi:hypothetical protein